jgi:stage V sporulation protein AF
MLTADYGKNVMLFEDAIGYGKSFDILEKRLAVGDSEVAFFYVDGFVKDGELQRVMQFFLSRKELGSAEQIERMIPYAEVGRCSEMQKLVTAVLSGQTVLFGKTFEREAIVIDLRTYPARQTAEPESDRVMQGARDGFVETLIMNTALLRRRIRDPRLKLVHFDIGGSSHTDVVVAYVEGEARQDYADKICDLIRNIKPKTLTLGTQSLAECLIPRRWINPFPKVRTTERPDTAAAQILEGSVLVFCDTSPEVMILPTSLFDFTEEADDYSFPPLTGTYLRLVRIIILFLSVIVTPIWYLAVEYGSALPDALKFLIPDEPGALPIILQLFIAEIALDGLKLASMNTPDMLSNSLSVVGALILGDFAVGIGWFSEDVIFYMACVAIANFAQQNHELGYAFKFMRLIILTLVYFFGIYGFVIGLIFFVAAALMNSTPANLRGYLYPLIPFAPRAMLRHLFRFKKKDVEN